MFIYTEYIILYISCYTLISASFQEITVKAKSAKCSDSQNLSALFQCWLSLDEALLILISRNHQWLWNNGRCVLQSGCFEHAVNRC